MSNIVHMSLLYVCRYVHVLYIITLKFDLGGPGTLIRNIELVYPIFTSFFTTSHRVISIIGNYTPILFNM